MPGASVLNGFKKKKRRGSEPVPQQQHSHHHRLNSSSTGITGGNTANNGLGAERLSNGYHNENGHASSTSSSNSSTCSGSTHPSMLRTSNQLQQPVQHGGGSRTEGTAIQNGSGGGEVKEKVPPQVVKLSAEVFEKDRETFLASFEKPTQIYRFLRARMIESPLFLQRNLSYMRDRMSRSHRTRIAFSVDNMLPQREESEKQKGGKEDHRPYRFSPRGSHLLHGPSQYYNLIIRGLTDGQIWLPDTKARVDVCIARVCSLKRKDGAGPLCKVFEQSAEMKVYSPVTATSPEECEIPLPLKCPVVAIPLSSCTSGVNGNTIKSFRMVVRVTIPVRRLQEKQIGLSSEQNHLNNRNSNYADSNNEQSKVKRRRSVPATKDRENFVYGGDSLNGSKGNRGMDLEESLVYTGHLLLFESDIPEDHLKDADFEIQLKKATRAGAPVKMQKIRREITFENLDEKHPKVLESIKPAGKFARVSISMRSSSAMLPQLVEPPSLVSQPSTKHGAKFKSASNHEIPKLVRVIFQFMYGNSTKQQTEVRDNLLCPWCSLNCMVLYSLMKHLKLCHPRYHFAYAPIPNGAKIDVSINESYDGSYSGSAFDLVSQPPGEAFARNGPTKRTEVFSILVCRPKPFKQTLQEFFDCDEKDLDQRRTYITGHNRLYHHTSTCLPIHPREIDVDSEGEPDPEWLRVKTTMMIDEFTDVNEGEKELMKLWNLHVMKFNYVGDCQIPLACKRFVELHGKELIEKNLYRNFCLHLTNLFDFGLLTPAGVHNTVNILMEQVKDAIFPSLTRNDWKSGQALLNGHIKNNVSGSNSSGSSPQSEHSVTTLAVSDTASDAHLTGNAKTVSYNTTPTTASNSFNSNSCSGVSSGSSQANSFSNFTANSFGPINGFSKRIKLEKHNASPNGKCAWDE